MADQRHLVTILFTNIRRLQPKTKEALVEFFESQESFGIIECTPEEMDAIKVVPFMPIERKSFTKALKRDLAPPVVKANEATATAAAIAELVGESEGKG